MCIDNSECEDLELLKVYRILPDSTAEKEGYLRVIDESGEDYLYPEQFFVVLPDVPLLEQNLLPLFNTESPAKSKFFRAGTGERAIASVV